MKPVTKYMSTDGITFDTEKECRDHELLFKKVKAIMKPLGPYPKDELCKFANGDGYDVHNPKYAVDQNDETGYGICLGHLEAMRIADRVDVFWDVTSKGSHFDLGMAFALKKPIRLVKLYQPDNEGKSYAKVMRIWGEDPWP